MSRPSTRERLLDVAEELMAERGVEAVSLREVGQAAEQRNNSAAQYHFGSKEGLVAAIIAERSAPVEAERARMIEGLSDTDPSVRQLLEVFVMPLADTLAEPSHYLRFLFQVMTSHVPDPGRIAEQPGMHWVTRQLRHHMPPLSAERFRRRSTWIAQITCQVLADLERSESAGASLPAEVLTEVVEDLLITLEALVTAPVLPA